MVDLYAIHPDDEPVYRRVIQRERALVQNDFKDEDTDSNVRCVMVVVPPAGFEVGKCAIVRRDPFYPYCYEVSVNGYPGFGILDELRFRYNGVEYSFPRNATNREIRNLLPADERPKMTVTGGEVIVGTETVNNPNWVNPATTTGSIPVNNPRTITQEIRVNVGRWFFGFTNQPDEFVFAETQAPGVADEYDYDPNGFTTVSDQRVTVRSREVPFLLSPVVRNCSTLVDTSTPSPIAAGALAYAARVPALGLSLMSIEPRVYQELSDVFDVSFEVEE